MPGTQVKATYTTAYTTNSCPWPTPHTLSTYYTEIKYITVLSYFTIGLSATLPLPFPGYIPDLGKSLYPVSNTHPTLLKANRKVSLASRRKLLM